MAAVTQDCYLWRYVRNVEFYSWTTPVYTAKNSVPNLCVFRQMFRDASFTAVTCIHVLCSTWLMMATFRLFSSSWLVKRKIYEKMFIQIKKIWYYNVNILKLKLSINYSDLNITVRLMPKRWVCSQGKFLTQDWVYFDNTVYT